MKQKFSNQDDLNDKILSQIVKQVSVTNSEIDQMRQEVDRTKILVNSMITDNKVLSSTSMEEVQLLIQKITAIEKDKLPNADFAQLKEKHEKMNKSLKMLEQMI